MSTDDDGHYRLTEEVVTDPARSAVVIHATVESLDGSAHTLGRPLRAGARQRRRRRPDPHTKRALKAVDQKARVASTLMSSPRLTGTSQDGRPYIPSERRPRSAWASAGRRRGSSQVAKQALGQPWTTTAAAVRRRLARLPRDPQAGPGQRRGDPARVPRLGPRPRGRRGQGAPGRLRRQPERCRGSGATRSRTSATRRALPRGLVARPLPDRHRPLRRWATWPRPGARCDWLFRTQQKKDGSFPQNSDVDGTEEWTELQLDEVTLPIALAHLVGKTDKRTYRGIKKAVGFLMKFRDEETGRKAPFSPQERWENQSGYSPATIAAEIDGLVTGAAIARQHGDAKLAKTVGAHRRQAGRARSRAGR